MRKIAVGFAFGPGAAIASKGVQAAGKFVFKAKKLPKPPIVAVPKSLPQPGAMLYKADNSVPAKFKGAVDTLNNKSRGVADGMTSTVPLRGHPKFSTPSQQREYLSAFHGTKFNLQNPGHVIGQIGFKAQKAFHNPLVQLAMPG